jgi:hypothetical protein
MTRRIGSILVNGIITLGLVLAPTVLLAQGLGGSFEGEVTQNDPPGTYTVQMELYGSAGSINYPSFPCSGELTFERTDGTTYWYRERITRRPDLCVNGGLISIRRHALGGDTNWEWRWVLGDQVVRGVLRGAGAPASR